MNKNNLIEVQGVVKKMFSKDMFKVVLKNNQEIIAYPSGKMQKFQIKILEGDKVTVELTPYDLTKGRITFCHKNKR